MVLFSLIKEAPKPNDGCQGWVYDSHKPVYDMTVSYTRRKPLYDVGKRHKPS